MSQKREAGTVRGSAKNTRKKGKKRSSAFLPVLFGITVAFALACAALCAAVKIPALSILLHSNAPLFAVPSGRVRSFTHVCYNLLSIA